LGRQRLHRLAGLFQQKADVVMADRQVTPIFGDIGVVVDDLLLDLTRLLVRYQCLRRFTSGF
jgi:hypothetical protein